MCIRDRGASAQEIFYSPQNEYTQKLLAAVPRLDKIDRIGAKLAPPPTQDDEIIIEAKDIKVHFPVKIGGGLFPKTCLLYTSRCV